MEGGFFFSKFAVECFATGKFTDFSVWLFETFIRKLSHLTISNLFEFIQVLSFSKSKNL